MKVSVIVCNCYLDSSTLSSLKSSHVVPTAWRHACRTCISAVVHGGKVQKLKSINHAPAARGDRWQVPPANRENHIMSKTEKTEDKAAKGEKGWTINGQPLTPEYWASGRLIPESLEGPCPQLYAAYKAAHKAAADARKAFEEAFVENLPSELPDDKQIGFSYRFGNLTALVIDGAPKSKAAPKGAMTFAMWCGAAPKSK